MHWKLLICIICSFSLFSNPLGLETMKGSVTLQHKQAQLHIHASDGAVLHWQDFSIKPGELTQFFQPSETSWVLNRVVGNHSSEILGDLIANGQIVLLNSHGILFGQNATVDVGGIIASTVGEGPIVNKGLIRARNGDVLLIGKRVECAGTIKTAVQTWVSAEENPYELAINFIKPPEATTVKAVNGRILLTSEEQTFVSSNGVLISKGINLFSNGITVFQGYADVENGFIEISGRDGFYYQGTTDRKGGLLILDPEANITISNSPFYNYSFEDGCPTTDISNISIDFLVDEINKGPVTITTSYQGEAGREGSIIITEDVAHTYQSPYPLIFNCSGSGGIHVMGQLRNSGTGEITFNSQEVSITGEIVAAKVESQGFFSCHGKLYAETLNIHSENGGFITGKVIADGGPITWVGGGTLSLKDGEIGNGGNDSFTLQGLENIVLTANSRLFTLSSDLTISDLSGALSLENSTVYSDGPLTISGKQGSLYLDDSTLYTNSSLNVNIGHYLYCHNSLIQAQQPITLMLGSDFILSDSSILTSPRGISLNNKGSLLMGDTSLIKGPGLSLIIGESAALLDESKIDGEMGALSLTGGENLAMEGNRATIQGGQVSIHIGGDLSLETHSKIASLQGPTTISAGKGISLFEEGSIEASGGNLYLSVTQGNLTLYGSSSLNSLTDESRIIVGKSLTMENFSSIKSIGEKGTTILIDQLGIGGGISLALNSSITTGSSPLRIFTTAHQYNSIQGTLNSHYYVDELPLFLTTAQDHWGVGYSETPYSSPGSVPAAPLPVISVPAAPLPVISFPFTVFHKEIGLIETPIGPISDTTFIQRVINYIGPFTAELFRDLAPYDQYIKDRIYFTDSHEPYLIQKRARK